MSCWLGTLAREWSAWCDVHVLLDPETFLGDGAGYLVSALHDEGETATAGGCSCSRMPASSVEGVATLAELYAPARGETLDTPAKLGFG